MRSSDTELWPCRVPWGCTAPVSQAIQLALMGSEAQQYPWQIRAIQYAARLPQLVQVWRGASAYPARPFADYPRAGLGGGGTPETDFAQMSIGPPKGDSRPASAQRLQRGEVLLEC